jgi:hypothetical protein
MERVLELEKQMREMTIRNFFRSRVCMEISRLHRTKILTELWLNTCSDLEQFYNFVWTDLQEKAGKNEIVTSTAKSCRVTISFFPAFS